MDYEEYLEKIKIFAKKTALWQRIIFAFFILIIIAGGIYLYNPQKKLLERRNSQRRTAVSNILNAVYQYSVDNGGELPFSISSEPKKICASKAKSCDGLIDISSIVSNKKYLLSNVPVDPREKNSNSSGYEISKLGNGRISVSAPLAENNATISLSK